MARAKSRWRGLLLAFGMLVPASLGLAVVVPAKARWRGLLLAFGILIPASLGLALANLAWGASESDQGFLAGLVSQALSTPSAQVHIGSVEGALSSDATIHDIAISDRDGVWLRLDRARLVWRRSALLLRRLEVDRLEIGHLEVLRRPLPSDVPPAATTADQPILPDLPVKVQIKDFQLEVLDLGKGVIGEAFRAKATGSTELGSPAEGLAFRLEARRLDSPGLFTANLAFVPKDDKLDLHVGLDEPEGGLLSKIGHIPGSPPVKFDLDGHGSLDDFKAGLTFVAGPTIDATGSASLKREEAGRHLVLGLGGRFGDLLPSIAGSIFAGKTELKGDMRFADTGAIEISSIAMLSRLARLEAHGSLSPEQIADFALTIGAVPSDGMVSRAGGAEIRKLAFEGRITGPIKAAKIDAHLAIEEARLPEGRLGSLKASFSATPSGSMTDQATRITLDGALTASGIVASDAALAQALGSRADLEIHGVTDTIGNGEFDRVELKTSTLALRYAGALGRNHVSGAVTADAPDLARFAAIAGLRLAGTSHLSLDLEGVPRLKQMRATLAARADKVATGLPTLDRLIGGSATAKGSLALAKGRYTVSAFDLVGSHVTAHVAGMAAPAAADLTATIAIPDLVHADERLSGRASVEAHVIGGLDRPSATLRMAIDGATALKRPIPNLTLQADIQDVYGLADTHVALDGMVDHKPATGAIHLARGIGVGGPDKTAGWFLSQLDLLIGSVVLHGSGVVDADALVTGRLHVVAANLDDLSPFALTKLSGSMALDAAGSAPDGRQSLTISANARDVHAASVTVRNLDLKADAKDLYAKPVVNADLAVDQAVVAGQAVTSIRFAAKGKADASAITLSAKAAGFDLDAAGQWLTGATNHLALTRLQARRGARSIALAGPADLAFGGGAVVFDHCVLSVDGGRVSLQGRAGRTLDLAVDAHAIPLAAADIVVPGLGLSGTLDASAKIAGLASAPTGSYRLSLARLVAPQTRAAGLAPIDMSASGRLDGPRATLDAKVTAPHAGTVTATGSVPTDPSGAIDLVARGTLDAAVANATLGPQGRQLNGSLAVDMHLAGTRAAPRVTGSVVLGGGRFRDALQGVQLDDLKVRLRADGDVLTVETASASTPNNGVLSASGRVRIDPDAGFPGQVSVRGHHATLVANSLMTASADLTLEMTGALARDPRIGGRIDIIGIDVAVPDRLPTTLKPIDGVTHVAPPPAVAARIAAEQKARAAKPRGRAALFDAMLDLTVSAPNRIFIRGRGLDAEVGGSLKITGSTEKPNPIGAFDLRRGRLAVLGKTLTFTKGRVAFSGDLMPELDFVAEAQAADVTAQVSVTGPAAKPVFAFTSQPDLPQDEVLSRLLFAKSSGSLSAFQALQLAQAAAQFSSGGDDAFERMRKSLGVDSLDISAGANGPSVGVSRAISDRVSVGVRTGATADQTGLSADVDVTRHIRVQSDVRSNGATSVGVGTEVEY